MKKIAFTMASILVATGAAFADDHTTLTTKNYVDSGLRAVYQKVKANGDAITNIQTVLNGDETTETPGLIQDVADLKAADFLTADDIAGKADQSDLDTLSGTVTTLQTTVEGKADASTVTTLSETVGEHTTAIAGLQDQIDAIDTTALTGEKGVTVDTTTHTVSLSVPEGAANDGNTYVYKDGAWTALDVEDEWNPNILN